MRGQSCGSLGKPKACPVRLLIPTTATSAGAGLCAPHLEQPVEPKGALKRRAERRQHQSEPDRGRDQPSNEASPKLLPSIATKLKPSAHLNGSPEYLLPPGLDVSNLMRVRLLSLANYT